MGVHDMISDLEGAAKLVKEWLTEVPTDPEQQLTAGAAAAAKKPCSSTTGCELAAGHEGGCQLEGKFTADAAKASP